jgi:hypothetical protein
VQHLVLRDDRHYGSATSHCPSTEVPHRSDHIRDSTALRDIQPSQQRVLSDRLRQNSEALRHPSIQASKLGVSTQSQRATQARTRHAGSMFACMRPVAQDEQEDAAGSPPGGSPQGSRRSSSRRNSGASPKGSPTSSRRTSAQQSSSTSRRSQLDLQIRAMVQAGGGKGAASSNTSRRRSSQNSVFRWVNCYRGRSGHSPYDRCSSLHLI